MQNTFKKNEKLISKKQIDLLFSAGISKFCYPVKFLFSVENESEKKVIQVLFSVPKKNIKNAVDRNKIKRQMREVYRKNKSLLNSLDKKINIAFIYIEKLPLDFSLIENAIIHHIKKLKHSFDKKME